MNEEKWSIEWSETQQCFHVDWLSKTTKKNLEIFLNPNNCNDWSLIAIADSHKQAHDIVNILRKKRDVPTIFEKFAQDHCQ